MTLNQTLLMKKTNLLEKIFYPFLLTTILIVLHFLGGAIQLDVSTEEAQRDLNTAVGTSLLSGAFLFSIRLIQQSVAKHLLIILDATERCHDFWIHRKELSEQFKKHLIWSMSVGFIMPLFYMLTEGVISRINEKEVFIVAMGAIPFWLLLSLYILQVTFVNRHLRKFLNTDDVELIDQIKMYESVITVATVTTSTTLFIFSIIPVFWINLPIHLFDMVFTSLLCIFFTVFLVSPLIQFYRRLREVKEELAVKLDERIEYLIKESVLSERSEEIERLLSEKEKYCSFKFAACINKS